MAWTETEYRVNHIDEYGDISDLDHYDTEAAAMAAYEAGPHWHEVEKETRYYRDRDHSSGPLLGRLQGLQPCGIKVEGGLRWDNEHGLFTGTTGKSISCILMSI
jgi:hypothetical protein